MAGPAAEALARDSRVDRILQTGGGLLLTICLGLAGYTLKLAVNNSERLTGIEASRFTVASGAELWREIAALREHMAKIPLENPPVWLKEQLTTLTATAAALTDRLNAIERTLARLEAQR